MSLRWACSAHILCLLLPVWVTSQNLVKNPSFEDFTDCPNALGTFDANVKHWSTPTGGTTDYFNTCSKVMGAPENFNGVQDPKFGNAYSGIYFYAPADYREYIQVALHRKLVQGKQYTLDFYISLAEGSDFAVKDFGVLFSQTALNINTKKNITRGQLFRIKGNKHHIIEINHPEFHEDKREWLKIEMEFEAKGFENFLILGNLRDNASTRKVRTKRRESKKGAYYYIDMITLKGEGAMAEAETMTTHTTHILKNVHFDYDKYRLDEKAKSELAQIYDYLVKNPELTITIHGHTDAQGTANYNQQLSESRAKTISFYLANLGLPTSRISWQGHGSTRPIAENSTEQGRRKNRRAEFELLEKKD